MTQRLTPEAHLAEIERMHEHAAEALGLNAAARAAQENYRMRLREQLSGKGKKEELLFVNKK